MGSCKYYMEVTLGWMLNNKVIVLLSLLTFALFVSTLSLAGRKNTLYWELDACRNPPTTTTALPTVTPAPVPPASASASVASSAAQVDADSKSLLQVLAGTS